MNAPTPTPASPQPRPAAKHTPGPWKVSAGCSQEIIGISGAGCEIPIAVASVEWRFGSPFYPPALEKAKANARLIAAAPALLEALRDCLGFWQSPPDGFGCSASRTARLEKIKTAARAAIAQAEGGAQ